MILNPGYDARSCIRPRKNRKPYSIANNTIFGPEYSVHRSSADKSTILVRQDNRHHFEHFERCVARIATQFFLRLWRISRSFSYIFDNSSLMWNGFTVAFLCRAQPGALLIAIFIVVIAWIFFSQDIVMRFLNLIPDMWNTILTTIRDLFPKILANRSFKPLTTTIDYWKVLYTTNTRLILCQNGHATCLNTSRRDV